MPNILLSLARRLMKHPHNFPLPFCPTPRRFVLLLCLLAAVAAAAFLLLENTWAQEGTTYDYVELVMLHETAPDDAPRSVAYRVQNAGTATAVGVVVSFRLENLEIQKSANFSPPPDTTTVACADGELTCQEFSWRVGSLLPGETSNPFTITTWPHSGLDTTATDWKGRVGTIKATASSNPPELGILMANNVIQIYSFAFSLYSRHMPEGRLGLLLSVDDLRPDAGGSVAFKLTAQNMLPGATDAYLNLIADASVKVELSDGLKFQPLSAWSGDDVPDSDTFQISEDRQSATWYPADTDTRSAGTIGALHEQSDTIGIQTQLTTD